MTDKSKTEKSHPFPSSHRLVIIAFIAALATFWISAFFRASHSLDNTMELSFGASYGWVAAQAFLLTVPGVLVGLAIGKLFPRTGAVVGAGLIFAVPIIVFCDVLTFAWIGERFLSGTMHRISTTLAPALSKHITRSSVIDAVIAMCVALVCMLITWWVAGWLARRWAASRDPVNALTTTNVLAAVALLVSTPAIWNRTRTVSEMRDHSTRHPFCAFHLVGYRGVGVLVPRGDDATLARLRGLQSAPDVQRHDQRLLAVELDKDAFRNSADKRVLHDVIVIVAESLRPEIIDPKVMPNLAAFAEKSIHCKQHFSEGNSTSYGVFGLVNGIEAVWFDRPVWVDPIMNRVLHQASYELGFFGGEDDWVDFQMDGYIRGAHFDRFEIEYPELLDTDYLSVQRTLDFIDEGKRLAREKSEHAVPRLAITYTLNTHFPYTSEKEDQIFQPNVEDHYVVPYSMADRDKIYNQYLNSARTLDRMIKPLLRDDCIVVVMGDHGESFLEDGSAIHGLRLSKVQNMTPMIMYYPGVKPRTIEQRTMHMDILPTLLSILNVPVTDPEVFDGSDLTTVDSETLAQRVFITSNFIDRSTGLIGPWTLDPLRPFAYRFVCKIGDWQIDYLNPIDDQGYECPDAHPPSEPDGRQLVRDWIAKKIGPEILREDLSEAELFTKFLRSPDRETRLSAMKIADEMSEYEPYLYDLISKAVRDEDFEIRELAEKIVIRTERYSGRN